MTMDRWWWYGMLLYIYAATKHLYIPCCKDVLIHASKNMVPDHLLINKQETFELHYQKKLC